MTFPENTQGESQRARKRRLQEGFYDDWCQGRGIDIGCGPDPLFSGIETWDRDNGQGDATHMKGVEDNIYDFVYASHLLEHLDDPWAGLRSWYRITKPGGFIVVAVPHRDLYEKKLELPSKWNPEHKKFWVMDRHKNQWTLGLVQTIHEALMGKDYTLMLARICMRNLTNAKDPTKHSWGEYSIEAVVKKGFIP
ncbi:MAG: methyltransferase domain-containing protein [Azonexus sp.]